jgi:hypothetical protein
LRSINLIFSAMINLIFSAMIKVPVLVSIMIALAAPAAAQSGGAANPSKEGKKTSAASQTLMVFYLAKGEPGSCGPACSEWIAAEGRFDEGSAQRLRAFLSRMGNRKLPILFHSSGGLATTASEIGRLLRDREMTAGVYQTIPAGSRRDKCFQRHCATTPAATPPAFSP